MDFRRLQPRLAYRLKKAIGLPTISLLALIVGAAGAVTAILSLDAVWSILILCGAVLTSVIIALVKVRITHIPDIIVRDISLQSNYKCCSCTDADLKEANDLCRPSYGRHSLPTSTLDKWRLTNNRIFMAIKDDKNRLVASFGIVPIRENFMEMFRTGRVTESQLGPEDIYPPADMQQARSLYVSGVVVREPESGAAGSRGRLMLWAMSEYLRELYGTSKRRKLYALAVTRDGEKLLTRLEWQIASAASTRPDRHNLFTTALNNKLLESIVHEVGDYKDSCDCKFSI